MSEVTAMYHSSLSRPLLSDEDVEGERKADETLVRVMAEDDKECHQKGRGECAESEAAEGDNSVLKVGDTVEIVDGNIGKFIKIEHGQWVVQLADGHIGRFYENVIRKAPAVAQIGDVAGSPGEDFRHRVGDIVEIVGTLYDGETGKVVEDDDSSMPYKVHFADNEKVWFEKRNVKKKTPLLLPQALLESDILSITVSKFLDVATKHLQVNLGNSKKTWWKVSTGLVAIIALMAVMIATMRFTSPTFKDIHYVQGSNFSSWAPVEGCNLSPPAPMYLDCVQALAQSWVISQLFGAVSVMRGQDEAQWKDWLKTEFLGILQITLVFVTLGTTVRHWAQTSASKALGWNAYTCYGALLTEGPWMASSMTVPLQYLATIRLGKFQMTWQGRFFDESNWAKGKGAVTIKKVVLLKMLAWTILVTFVPQYGAIVVTHTFPGILLFAPMIFPIIGLGYFISACQLGALDHWKEIRKEQEGEPGAELADKMRKAEKLLKDAQEAYDDFEKTLQDGPMDEGTEFIYDGYGGEVREATKKAELTVKESTKAYDIACARAKEFQFILIYCLPLILAIKLSEKISFYGMANFYAGMSWYEAICVVFSERQIGIYTTHFKQKILKTAYQAFWFLDAAI